MVVEDDDSIADFLRVSLVDRGFEVCRASDGQEAISMFRRENPDILLLDLNLPGLEGTDVLREVRKHSQIPVLIVSVRNDEVDKVCALELGADDYITKPFSAKELIARVRAHLRREGNRSGTVTLGELVINWKRAEVFRDGDRVLLSSQEFDLLQYLFQNRDRVLPRRLLVERLWGYDFDGEERVVDTAITRLRRKIGSSLIETVRGKGYRMVAP